MTTDAKLPAVSLAREAHLVVTVRVAFDDGVVHYLEVRGVSNGEDAVQLARQHAELERAGVKLFSASVTNAVDLDPPETS